MSTYSSLEIAGFDFVEFAVGNLEKVCEQHLRLGFEKTAVRQIRERSLVSYLLTQNDISIVLSHSQDAKDPVSEYVAKHGDGICNVALRCKDAHSAFQTVINRGAEVCEGPKSHQKEFGSVQQASIKAFGDVRHTFISRQGTLFLEGFETPFRSTNKGFGLSKIDHLTNNLPKGEMDKWAGYYEKIFGLENTRFFDIHTERTGLYSKVMESPDHEIKMPLNEPTESASQIQEFLDIHHGPGVQHLALTTENILETVPSLRKQGIAFLEGPPSTYYEAIPSRTPQVTENLSVVQDLGILIDGDTKGYLLQIFTQNTVGPFFYEVIQRKGNNGFGEGNFKALFEAIERDQIRRGVLKE